MLCIRALKGEFSAASFAFLAECVAAGASEAAEKSSPEGHGFSRAESKLKVRGLQAPEVRLFYPS
jgi:hypothetical protein